jgi:Type I phosphodiesterase / nucleotide pyrophosphatase
MPAKRIPLAAFSFSALLLVAACSDEGPQPRNLILFVPDGLRALQVSAETAPTMAGLRDRGVNFANPHSLFPTFTMPNASGLATGHYLGDTGAFGNTIFTGYSVTPAGGSMTPFIESDPVLGDIDAHFAGDYLNETTILNAARARGFSTAAIGKLGPTLQFDHTERSGERTITVDDATGSAAGIPLSEAVKAALTQAGLPLAAPSRGENGKAGDFRTAGTTVANVTQQAYFADVATKVVLPIFKAKRQPFLLMFWSRDPDGTQHNQGDSLSTLTPGINGPTSLAAVKNADNNLKQLMDALHDLGLAETTDIVIAADHGFSTISKESETSAAAKGAYADVAAGRLPPGFVAIDLAKALSLPLFDPDSKNAPVAETAYPRLGNGLIGQDPAKPDVVVAANGGSDLVYVPSRDRELAARVVAELLKQDYVSGLFVDDDLGKIPGTLPLTAIGLKGSAITPYPAIVVNFRTYSTGCEQPLLCTVSVADTRLQQGQGMHGSFSRADTMNFMAAAGPSFKSGFVDPAPVSNADVGKTIAKVLDLNIPFKGLLSGRVIEEALPGGEVPSSIAGVLRSEPSADGLVTLLAFQRVGTTSYYGAAGFANRTVGLPAQAASR